MWAHPSNMTVHHDWCLWILTWGQPQQGLASSGEAWQQSTSPRFSVRGQRQPSAVSCEREGTEKWKELLFVIPQIKRLHSRKLGLPLLSEARWLWKMACSSNNLSLTLKAPGDKTPHSPCHLGCWEIHFHTMEWERVRVLRRGTNCTLKISV